MKKALLSLVFLALASFGLPALAQVPLSGFYLGGSIGLAEARSVCGTTWLPAGTTVEFLVEMSNPGDWMLHCHIAEHLSADMMMEFQVLPR